MPKRVLDVFSVDLTIFTETGRFSQALDIFNSALENGALEFVDINHQLDRFKMILTAIGWHLTLSQLRFTPVVRL